MTNMFGVSMDLIMYVLVFMLAVSVSTLLVVYLRNRVLFRLGAATPACDLPADFHKANSKCVPCHL